MKKVSIIGLGWLGYNIAKSLKNNGIEILGTVSSKAKCNALKSSFNQIVSYKLGEDELSWLDSISKSDAFIITIPPSSIDNYSISLIEVCRYLKIQSPLAKIIYCSSSSVYGPEYREADERSNVNPVSMNAQKIVAFENLLIDSFSNSSVIMRLAGLVGNGKHPVNTLSQKKQIPKPNAVVNLVHEEDICRFILHVLSIQFEPGIYNLSMQDHPTKSNYYSWAAKQKGIPVPAFKLDDNLFDKVVICNAIKNIGFQFKYESPYDVPFN